MSPLPDMALSDLCSVAALGDRNVVRRPFLSATAVVTASPSPPSSSPAAAAVFSGAWETIVRDGRRRVEQSANRFLGPENMGS